MMYPQKMLSAVLVSLTCCATVSLGCRKPISMDFVGGATCVISSAKRGTDAEIDSKIDKITFSKARIIKKKCNDGFIYSITLEYSGMKSDEMKDKDFGKRPHLNLTLPLLPLAKGKRRSFKEMFPDSVRKTLLKKVSQTGSSSVELWVRGRCKVVPMEKTVNVGKRPVTKACVVISFTNANYEHKNKGVGHDNKSNSCGDKHCEGCNDDVSTSSTSFSDPEEKTPEIGAVKNLGKAQGIPPKIRTKALASATMDDIDSNDSDVQKFLKEECGINESIITWNGTSVQASQSGQLTRSESIRSDITEGYMSPGMRALFGSPRRLIERLVNSQD